MLHYIFQRHHIPPHEVYNWDEKWKQFAYASMSLVLEEEKREMERIQNERRS